MEILAYFLLIYIALGFVFLESILETKEYALIFCAGLVITSAIILVGILTP